MKVYEKIERGWESEARRQVIENRERKRKKSSTRTDITWAAHRTSFTGTLTGTDLVKRASSREEAQRLHYRENDKKPDQSTYYFNNGHT